MSSLLAADLRRLIGSGAVLDNLEDRAPYAYDGTTARALPEVVDRVETANLDDELVAGGSRRSPGSSNQGVRFIPWASGGQSRSR